MAAGVVPQSSCSFSAQAPPRIISSSAPGVDALPLPVKCEVHRKCVCRFDHAREMPRPRRAGGGERSRRRTGAASQHGGDARHQRFVDLLRADEVNVRVEAARGDDLAFRRDDLRARPDDDIDIRLDVRIAGFSDSGDPPVADADIGFHHAPVIENDRIGDDGIHRPVASA